MQILCPVCSTSIDITEDHLGQKARCLGCTSKFIIPATVGGEFQILERGSATTPPVESAQAAPATKAAPSAPATAGPKVAPAAPATAGSGGARPSAAAQSIAARSMARKKPGGSAGFVVVCLLLGGGLIFGWMKMSEKSKDVADTGESTDKPKTPKKVTIPAPNPTTEPNAPDPAQVTPEPAVAQNDPEPEADPDPTMDMGNDTAPFKSALLGEAPPQIDDEKKARALAFLKAKNVAQREGTYKAFRKLGEAQKPTYASLLKEARAYHLEALGNKAFDLSIGENALSEFESAHTEWRTAADAAVSMVQTNWKTVDPAGYKAKHSEMDSAFENVERLYGKLPKAMQSTGGGDLATLQAGADILAEFAVELAWAAGDNDQPQPLRDLLKEAGGADDFVEILDLLTATRTAVKEAEDAAVHNDTINFGTATYKAFAVLLNQRRLALGLGALRLDQKLSEACEGHSGDMHFQAYFSHTGKDGSSFGQRAKRAGFEGGASGECIFKGSGSATAAHKAWWYSDGHRLIMYAGGPNTLGLGTAADVWTLNTGKKRW
jgi:hypothetical protein